MATPRFRKADLLFYYRYLVTLLPLLVAMVLLIGLLAFSPRPLPTERIILTGLLAIAGVTVTIWVAMGTLRQLMRPLKQLARAMRKLKAGDFQTRVQEVSAGDMGDLERGFNVMADQMMSINEQLLRDVDRATAELQETLEALEIRNADLDIARRKALEANRLKEDFLANMSHQLRTPMNGIVGFGDLLEQTPLSDQQRGYLSSLRYAAQSMAAIVGNILEYAKLESGTITLQQEPLSLRETIDSVVQMHAPQAHAKGLEMVSFVYGDVPDPLIGDRSRIIQMLSNILSNALKFTREGEVVLRVMLEDERGEQVTLAVSISDTGIGIPAADRDYLFDAFGQSSLTQKGVFDGAGLGLRLCRLLATAMDGEVRVNSIEGVGSTFKASMTLQRQPDAPHLPPPLFQRQKVLLLEPHGLARIALRNLLELQGLDVEDTQLLREKDLQPEHGYALALVCSTGKPEDLEQAQRALRKLSAQRVPCLALLGSSDPNSMQGLVDAGAHICLSKPTPLALLQQRIQELVKQSPAPLEQQEQPLLQGLRCLTVDDNSINLQVLQLYIEQLGGEAVCAKDGYEALQAAQQQDIDIGLLDIHMPGMDGLELAKALRTAEPSKCRRPLIALTADAADRNMAEIEQAGFDRCLIKPVSLLQLQECLGDLLSGVATQPASQTSQSKPGSIDPSSLPAWDMQQALRVAGGSEAIAEKLFKDFLRELPNALQEIESLHAEQQWDSLWHAAHKLKGAAAVCAVSALQACLEQLEGAAKFADFGHSSAYLDQTQAAAQHLLSSYSPRKGSNG